MTSTLYPLLFTPVYKDYIWGGRRIPQRFNREQQADVCAESWEISDRPEGMSVVSNGPMKGSSLHQLVETMGKELLGSRVCYDVFPLLIKIIDAKQRLSVQVHPDNNTAAICGGEPKTEMWYVLDTDPDARIFVGLKPGTSPDLFEKALEQQKLEDVLTSVPAQPGMAIYVPGGRVHAIGEGCLLLEIQQNSNTTYRVYDWGRLGKDGKPRDLHIAQAMKVISWKDETNAVVGPEELESHGRNSRWKIIDCPYFTVTRLELTESEPMENDGSGFRALFVAAGQVDIKAGKTTEQMTAGTSCLIPAALNRYTLYPVNGKAQIICIQPDNGDSCRTL